MATRAEALALYRSLVRSSKQFSTYNFREYFLRRTRYAIVVDIDLNIVLRVATTLGNRVEDLQPLAGKNTYARNACTTLLYGRTAKC